ncbi:MAG: Na+:solute symporter [Planctomycetes bacterium]|nr:Na+:solute symporter [Planctomycetota bacterium]
MSLTTLDLAVLAVYFAATLAIGFWISRRASRSLRNYFLGGNSVPWYALGLSNASGMFDISGTMVMVAWLFVYGLKSVWIPWLWPVFNQVFMMVYLSIWLRRSRVMTGAEWIRFRFGEGAGSHLSHLIVVLYAMLIVISFLAYGFVGIGKFAATMLPWQLSTDPVTNDNLYGLIITAITTIYVVKGGMLSVVFTEVLQFIVMTVACVWVGIIAMQAVSPELLATKVPAGWDSIFFGARLDLDWSGILDAANDKITKDGWEFFSAFFMLLLVKGWLQSMAGPRPDYDMQRVLSARTPREAALMSWFVNVVLLIPRYILITGLTVLALAFFTDELASGTDDANFERILPLALRDFVQPGLLGLVIAGLMAAFMSTYAATVNAAPAYIVNDIYKRYINPHASERNYVRMSYATSIAVVILGTAIGFAATSLNNIVEWITAALFGGYTASNVLKWYWWRFNSYGYFGGMITGLVAVAIVPELLPNLAVIYSFPIILVISLAGCVIVSLLTPPDDVEVLKRFYLQVRPWGLWRPIHDLVAAENPGAEANTAFGHDMLNVLVGIVWQTALTTTGIYLVLQDYRRLAWSIGVVALTSVWLKYRWYDKLENYPSGYASAEEPASESQARPGMNEQL